MTEARSMRVRTTGMHCQSCAMLVKMNLEDLDGVDKADVDLARGMTEVTYDPDRVDEDEILKAIETAGYGAAVQA